MKYFTRELLSRCRSSNDDVAEAAANAWEKATAAYTVRLEKIRSRLPKGVRQLLNHVTLHDAQLLTIKTAAGKAKKDLFLTFRLAGSPKVPAGGVELRYSLSGRTTLSSEKDGVLTAEPFTPYLLYDEFDVEQKRDVTSFTHSLLMTAGLELCIRFSNLRVKWFGTMLPASIGPAEIEKEWEDDDLLAIA